MTTEGMGSWEILGLALLLWQVLSWVLMGAVLLTTWWVRSPLVRSWLLRAAMVGVLVIPMGIWVPEMLEKKEPSETVTQPTEVAASTAEETPLVLPSWDDVAVWKPLLVEWAMPELDPLPGEEDRLTWAGWLLRGLVLIWSVALYLGAMRWFRAYLESRAWLERGLPVDADTQAAGEAAAEKLEVEMPDLVRSAELASPMLLGLRRPVLLLPQEFPMTEAVWRHEFNHLLRADLGWHFIAAGLSHTLPLLGTTWLWSAMRQADEEVSDDAAVEGAKERKAYADELLQVAEQHSKLAACGISMAASGSLEKRLLRLLDSGWQPAKASSRLRCCLVLVPLLIVVSGLGFVYADATTAWARGGVSALRLPPVPPPLKTESASLAKLVKMYDQTPVEPMSDTGTIREIKVALIGPRRMTDREVAALTGLKVGEPYQPGRVATATRKLYRSGHFYNLRVSGKTYPDGVVIEIIVQFNYQIRDHRFEGFSPEQLKETEYYGSLARFRLGKVVSAHQLHQEAQRLQYEMELPNIDVRWDDIREEAGMATVLYTLKEDK